MPVHGIAAKAATTVVTGAVGVAAYEALRRAVAKAPLRAAGVTAATWALRGARKAEEGAETARLTIADVVAEARERIGEDASAPAAADAGPEHHH